MTTKYSDEHSITRRMVSDLASEIELDKAEIARLRARESKVVNNTTSTTGSFTKVDPRQVAYAPSGTNGDGTYQAASTVDFSSIVPAGTKLVYIYVETIIVDIGVSSPWFGFTWKPTGWTDTIEDFHVVYPDGDIEDHRNLVLPLGDTLTVDIAVVKCENGVGEAWSYSFEVWGYE